MHPPSKIKIPRTFLPESPGGSGAPVGFINLGSLGDRLPCQGSTQADGTQLMGRPKDLKQQAERAVQSPTGRSGRRGTTPARRLLRPTSPTGALALDSSRLRTVSPIGRPGPSTTSDSNPASSTGVRRNPAHRSSPTGATRADWGYPIRVPRNRAHRCSPTGATRADWGHLTGNTRSERTRDK